MKTNEFRVIKVTADDEGKSFVMVNEYTGYATLKMSAYEPVKLDMDDLPQIVELLQEAVKQLNPPSPIKGKANDPI